MATGTSTSTTTMFGSYTSGTAQVEDGRGWTSFPGPPADGQEQTTGRPDTHVP